MAKQDEERARRLAAALRENLKRRKAQARESAVQESSRRTQGPVKTKGED